ncbi:MAG TPA: GNAT family N-acetyltransferase [Kofleriaceae bacterium]|jgi:GNAT superfamily N-acetyltransferase|nr:GNAT family N-acetyltransferase [Kofleriaceae bacterium]
MKIRAATIDDADELVALIDSAAAALTARLGPGYWSKRASPRRMRERIEDSDPALLEKGWFVAAERSSDGEDLVGVIALATRPFRAWKRQLWARPEEAALGVFDLAVHARAWRTGVGRALMRFAERTARARGLGWVRLDAFAENPHSNAFYRAIGYDERGEVSAGGVPLVLYERQVKKAAARRSSAALRSS